MASLPDDPTACLPDDLVVDILSRLPVKSLFRCKSVSWRWRALISNADHCRKLPQLHPTLFYCSSDSSRFPEKARHVTNVWEGPRRRLVCPSLSFVPGYERMSIVDCVGSILLCRTNLQGAFRYVLCIPVRKHMVFLPDSGCGANKRVARLVGARIFEFVCDEQDDEGKVVGANIFSIETEAWSYKEGGWFEFPYFYNYHRSVYFNGYLFSVTNKFELSVVDMEGNLWCSIFLPLTEDEEHESSVPEFIGIYKDNLCYISELEYNELSIWILEDISTDDWVKKHHVSLEVLCQKQIGQYESSFCYVVGILPDCNFILYVADRTLMAYDPDSEEVHAIQNLEKGCCLPYFLYGYMCHPSQRN